MLADIDHSPDSDDFARLESELFDAPGKPEPAITLEPVLCRSGEDALAAVAAARREGYKFPVAFLDVRMPPGIDGVETAARIRALDPEIQIVIVTAFADRHPSEIARQVPPLDKLFYIVKPLEPAEIHQFALVLAAKWDADRQLRHLNEDLARRCDELATAQTQQSEAQKMEAVWQLTGGVAHHFNNLLMVVLGNLEFAAQEVGPGNPACTSIDIATRAASRGADVVRQLLEFVGRRVLRPQLVDLNNVIRALLPALERIVGEGVSIQTHLAPDLYPTLTDREHVESSLINLARNAGDAMPEGGRLTIATANCHLESAYAAQHRDAQPGQYVMLALSDTGGGIPPEILSRVCEPFFTTKPIGKGNGLGLSTVYGFVRQSGGHVHISSELGHGTTVRLYFP